MSDTLTLDQIRARHGGFADERLPQVLTLDQIEQRHGGFVDADPPQHVVDAEANAINPFAEADRMAQEMGEMDLRQPPSPQVDSRSLLPSFRPPESYPDPDRAMAAQHVGLPGDTGWWPIAEAYLEAIPPAQPDTDASDAARIEFFQNHPPDRVFAAMPPQLRQELQQAIAAKLAAPPPRNFLQRFQHAAANAGNAAMASIERIIAGTQDRARQQKRADIETIQKMMLGRNWNATGAPDIPPDAPDTSIQAIRRTAEAREAAIAADPGGALNQAATTVGRIAPQMAAVIAAARMGGPLLASIVTGEFAAGQVYEDVYARLRAQGHADDQAGQLAKEASDAAWVIGAATGPLVGNSANMAVNVGANTLYSGIQAAAEEVVTSAATGEKPDWGRVLPEAGAGGLITLGMEAVARLPHGVARFGSRVKAARNATELRRVVERALADAAQGKIQFQEVPGEARPPTGGDDYEYDVFRGRVTRKDSPRHGWAQTKSGIQSPEGWAQPSVTDVRAWPELGRQAALVHPSLDAPPQPTPRRIRTEAEIRSMNAKRLRALAQEWGVPFDSPSLTIPRILDAQRQWRIEQLSDQELYRAVKDMGLRAGNRQYNIDILLGRARYGDPIHMNPAPIEPTGQTARTAEAPTPSREPSPVPPDQPPAPTQETAARPGTPGRPVQAPEPAGPSGPSLVPADPDALAPGDIVYVRDDDGHARRGRYQPAMGQNAWFQPEGSGRGYPVPRSVLMVEKGATPNADAPQAPAGATGESRPTVPKSPAKRPRPFTKPDLEARIIAKDQEYGGGYSSADEADLNASGAGHGQFTFLRKLPEEITNWLEGHPDRTRLRKMFSVTDDPGKAGGEDAMADLGDRYFQLAEEIGGKSVRRALERLRGNPDPEAQLLVAIYDNLPPGKERPAWDTKKPDELRTGAEFEMAGMKVRVIEDADGFRVLKDGEDFDPIPVDSLAEVPVDKGTLRQFYDGDTQPKVGQEATLARAHRTVEQIEQDIAGISNPLKRKQAERMLSRIRSAKTEKGYDADNLFAAKRREATEAKITELEQFIARWKDAPAPVRGTKPPESSEAPRGAEASVGVRIAPDAAGGEDIPFSPEPERGAASGSAPTDVGPTFAKGQTSIGERQLVPGQVAILNADSASAALREVHSFAANTPGRQPLRAVVYRVIDDAAAAQIKAKTGLDVAGYSQLADNYAARHAHREHGILSQEELRGQLPITADDYARIPEITVPENIERTGTTRQGLPAIVYRKQSNGVTYLVEEVRNKRGQLATTAIYKLKSGGKPTGKATPAETDARYNRDTPPLSEDSIGLPRPQVNEKAGPEGMADSAPGGVTGTSSHSFSQPAQMAGAGQVKVKASEIIQALSDAIGTPFRVGHGFFAQRKAAGWYNTLTDVERQKVANDLTTAAHEWGHAIHKKILGWNLTMPEPVKAELDAMGQALYGTRNPNAGYTREGFAEFVSRYMNGDDMHVASPETLKWFEGSVLPAHPELARNWTKIKRMYDNWIGQGAVARVKSQINRMERGFMPALRSAWEKLQTMVSKHWWTNDQALLEDAERRLIAQGIAQGDITGDLPPVLSPSKTRGALQMTAAGTARHFLFTSAVNTAFQTVGPSLKEILAPIKGRVEDFLAYAYGRRAQVLHARGINPGISQADADYTVSQLDTPEFRAASDAITAWADHLVDYVVDAGGLSPEAARAMRAVNPVYLPLKRFFDRSHLGRGGEGTGKGVASTASPTKRLRGSGREILDPLESLVGMAEKMILAGNKASVQKAIIDLSELVKGSGWFAEKVQPPADIQRFKLEEIKTQLEAAGADLSGADLDEFLTVYGTGIYHGKDNIVSLWRNGKQEWWEIDPDVFRTVTDMDKDSIPAFLKVLTVPTKAVRMGAVGLRASFGLFNVIRDAWTLAVYGKKVRTPFASLQGLWAQIKNKPEALAFDAAGVGGSTQMGFDRATAGAVASKLTTPDGLKDRLVRVVTHPYDTAAEAVDSFRSVLEALERAPRIVEFRDALKAAEAKYGPGTRSAMIEAILAAKDVTTDFTRGGVAARIVNQFIPFFNARVQSASKFYRLFSGADGKQAALRATGMAVGLITVPSLALWMLNKDEQWYQELPDHERFNFWHFSFDGGKNIIRIPMPFELGKVFGSAPVAAIDALYRREGRVVADAAFDITKGFFPLNSWYDAIPSALKPVAEAMANYDSFRDRYIVSPFQEQSKLPADQYRKYTTETAKVLGAWLNVSPQKIEHVMSGYTGGLLTDAIRAMEHTPNLKETRTRDLPGLGRFWMTDAPAKSKTVQRFFERQALLRQTEGSGKATAEEKLELDRLNRAADRMAEVRKAKDAGEIQEAEADQQVMELAREAMGKPTPTTRMPELKDDRWFTTLQEREENSRHGKAFRESVPGLQKLLDERNRLAELGGPKGRRLTAEEASRKAQLDGLYRSYLKAMDAMRDAERAGKLNAATRKQLQEWIGAAVKSAQ